MEELETLCILVHGEPGTGKSWLAQTTPYPRLILDAEGGANNPKRLREDGSVEKIPAIQWDPLGGEEPPVDDGTWETCTVIIRSFEAIQSVFGWLNTGKHPFRSVVIDSITEAQKRCKDSIRQGDEVMNERMWGMLLDRMEGLVRSYRDLSFHPTKPLDCVMFTALTGDKSGLLRPTVQGKLGLSLPGYAYVVGYLGVFPTESGGDERKMLIRPHDRYLAKDRTHTLTAHYDGVITDPDITEMIAILNETGE